MKGKIGIPVVLAGLAVCGLLLRNYGDDPMALRGRAAALACAGRKAGCALTTVRKTPVAVDYEFGAAAVVRCRREYLVLGDYQCAVQRTSAPER